MLQLAVVKYNLPVYYDHERGWLFLLKCIVGLSRRPSVDVCKEQQLLDSEGVVLW